MSSCSEYKWLRSYDFSVAHVTQWHRHHGQSSIRPFCKLVKWLFHFILQSVSKGRKWSFILQNLKQKKHCHLQIEITKEKWDQPHFDWFPVKACFDCAIYAGTGLGRVINFWFMAPKKHVSHCRIGTGRRGFVLPGPQVAVEQMG